MMISMITFREITTGAIQTDHSQKFVDSKTDHYRLLNRFIVSRALCLLQIGHVEPFQSLPDSSTQRLSRLLNLPSDILLLSSKQTLQVLLLDSLLI